MKFGYCKKHFFKQRSIAIAAVAAVCLVISSGVAMGDPSKRPVAPDELVPQEDALMEARSEQVDAEAGASLAEGAALQTIAQVPSEVNEASLEVGNDRAGPIVQEIGNGPISTGSSVWHKLDAGDRRYAAVKMVENGIWFKFAEGKSYLADGAKTALNSVLRLKQGESFVIVTYKDTGLSDADNETLAYTRAQNIQKILLGLKISNDRIVMLKPRIANGEPDFALFPDRVDLRVEEGVNYTQEEIFKE